MYTKSRFGVGCLVIIIFLTAFPFISNARNIEHFDAETELKTVEAEAKCFVSTGPTDQEKRPICVWRPKGHEADVLPVIYMADGMRGIWVAVAQLRPYIDDGSIKPFMVVGTNANEDFIKRGSEYLWDWDDGTDAFLAHEKWFFDFVIPWAERTQNASADPESRYIGGFSNGADFSRAMLARHPEAFAGGLLHSPVRADYRLGNAPEKLRWVVTGGTKEKSGTIFINAEVPTALASRLRTHRAEVRTCIGPWKHELSAWRQLSPGSLVWLMQLGDYKHVEMPLEQKYCRVK